MEKSKQRKHKLKQEGTLKNAISIFHKIRKDKFERKREAEQIDFILKKNKPKEISFQEISYILNSTPTDKEEFNKFYSEVMADGISSHIVENYPEAKPISKERSLELYCNEEVHQNKIKILSNFKISEIDSYKFFNLRLCTKEFHTLLLSISYLKQNFVLICNERIEDVNKFNFYCLREALSQFTRCILFNETVFSQESFCLVIKAIKGVETVEFGSCTIITDSECNFGEMNGCKLKTISLHKSDDEYYSNWVHNRKRLHNILAGIDKCENLRNSIKRIRLFSEFNEELAEEFSDEVSKNFPRLKHIDTSY